MPNRTIYLSDAQDAEFRRGRAVAHALQESVGAITSKALGAYADANLSRIRDLGTKEKTTDAKPEV